MRGEHLIAALALALVVYFGVHAIDGSRGWLAWQQYQRELAAVERELVALRAERAALQHKVERLRHSSIDPDLLDEVARHMLALTGPSDVIVLLEDQSAGK